MKSLEGTFGEKISSFKVEHLSANRDLLDSPLHSENRAECIQGTFSFPFTMTLKQMATNKEL